MVSGIWSLRILIAYFDALSWISLTLRREPKLNSNADELSDVYACVGIQPFLLIVRTDRIVTAHHCASSVGYSEFPAFSRIYRQRNPLSHDVLNPARVPL